jgi:P-type E1-E2 ATPase
MEIVPQDALGVGDVVLVRPGGRVPADGVIVDGEAELDESMVTGESRPVAKQPGDRVVAGTVVTDSAVRIRVEAVGDETTARRRARPDITVEVGHPGILVPTRSRSPITPPSGLP